MVFGLANNGTLSNITVNVVYLFIYFLQAVAYMSLALLIAILIRGSVLSVIIFLCAFIIEGIAQIFTPNEVDQYFPMQVMSGALRLCPGRKISRLWAKHQNIDVFSQLDQTSAVVITLIYVFMFWGGAALVVSARDVK